ncbi:MAG: hypothetical protein N0A00_02205 [Candidatus Bathyarchaeota archaeon]|nr:hypothetical protein [Candidatus Bathyarchaeota archaeon]
MNKNRASFFSQKGSLQEIFPEIEEIDLYIKSTNLAGEIKTEYYFKDIRSIPSQVKCGNSECREGGYNIVLDIIMPVYHERKTEKEGTIVCRGYEKIGMGTRSCLHAAHYKLRIKYKT